MSGDGLTQSIGHRPHSNLNLPFGLLPLAAHLRPYPDHESRHAWKPLETFASDS